MALSSQRIGEIAFAMLQHKMEQDDGGVRLNPKGIKRDIVNGAKKIGITPSEGAELAKIIIKTAYEKTMAELDTIIEGRT